MVRFVFAFLLVLVLASSPIFARPSDDPIDETDRQRLYLDQVMRGIEQQRSQQAAENKVEIERRAALQKKRAELRLAEQFSGLSGTLSGLPEMPSFEGRFETQIPEVSNQSSEKKENSES